MISIGITLIGISFLRIKWANDLVDAYETGMILFATIIVFILIYSLLRIRCIIKRMTDANPNNRFMVTHALLFSTFVTFLFFGYFFFGFAAGEELE